MDNLVVVILMLVVTATHGDGECLVEGFKFYARTHSCFGFFSLDRKYFDCRNKQCNPYKGGVKGNEPGFVASILDSETNTFLTNEMSSQSKPYWIGLNDHGRTGVHEWDGLKGVTPNYFSWASGQPDSNKDYRNVILTKDGWKKVDTDSAYGCICEVKAAIPPMSVTLNADSPLKIGVNEDNVATCSSSGSSWTKLTWARPDGQDVVTCDGQSSCTSISTGYAATLTTGIAESKLQISTVHSRDKGSWKCVAESGDKQWEESFEIQVYEPAKEITCQHEFIKDGVEVICNIHCIFPQADCRWQWKHGEKNPYQTLSTSQSSQTQRNSLSPSGDYFSSRCVMKLEKNKFYFQHGSLYLKITVRPDVDGKERVETSSSVSNITIELPNMPRFKVSNSTRVKDSVTFISGDQINITCYVYHGKPNVYSTTLKCDFPFRQDLKKGPDNMYKDTWTGKSVVLHTKAINSMDGQRCLCSGQHLTGDTGSTELVFNVQYPAKVTDFKVEGVRSISSKFEVYRRTSIRLTCTYGGNPMPTVTIRHTGSSGVLPPTSYSRFPSVRTTFKADCSSNGEYVCEGQNSLNGEMIKFQRTLEINVKCPPTPCTAEDKNKTIGANVDTEARVSVCLYANPKPDFSLFTLFSDTSKKYLVYEVDYTMSLDIDTNARVMITVILLSMKENLFGRIRMHYNRKHLLQLYLKPKGAPFCPSEADVVDEGHQSLTMQWTPGSNHELYEYYVIYLHNGSISTSMVEIMANETSDTKGNVTYTLSGLAPESSFNISIGTKNKLGERQCTDRWFSASTLGVPFCPSEADVVDEGHQSLTMQWTPGSNHEPYEYYVIYLHSGSISTSMVEILANETSDTKGNVTYTLSGLAPGSSFNISIGTKNKFGERQCTDMWFSAFTLDNVAAGNIEETGSRPLVLGDDADDPPAEYAMVNKKTDNKKSKRDPEASGKAGGGSWTILGIVVAVVVILLILVIIVVVLLKRKRRQQNPKTKRYDNVAAGNIEETGSRPLVLGDDADDPPAEYAMVNKKTDNKKSSQTKKKAMKTEDDEVDTPAEYAVVNKKAAKNKSNKTKKKAMKTKDAEVDTLAEYAVVNKKAANKNSGNTYLNATSTNKSFGENVYNNDVAPKLPAQDFIPLDDDKNGHDDIVDGMAAYSNTIAANGTEPEEERIKRTKSKKNEDKGLVYVTVEFDRNNDKFKVKDTKDKEKEEPVEYMSIDQYATKQLDKSITDNPEGKKNEDKGLVYVTVEFDRNNDKFKVKDTKDKEKEEPVVYMSIDQYATKQMEKSIKDNPEGK